MVFDGTCEAAFKFYQKCLGGEIVMMRPFGDSPGCEEMPPASRDKIMHARLVVDDQVLMASDNHPAQPYDGVKGCSMTLNVDTPADAERIFNALVKDGTVTMPLEKTFWAASFGMLVDQFGVPWMVNCENAD
ncbi:MAG: VOC family protein [Lysobacter sp.]